METKSIDNMISLELAEEIINRNASTINETEIVSLNHSLNRVLAEDVFSDMDMPPFDKSAMDGYACRREDLFQPLDIIETIAAGTEPQKAINKGQCAKIMTGAKVPSGANCVIMIENTSLTDDGKVQFTGKNSSDNICQRGEDIVKGSLVLQKGLLINPQTMAVLASVGKTNVLVAKNLNVGVFCTGSEIVEPHAIPSGVQIRNSNASQLIAQITVNGAIPDYHGIIADNRDLISNKINELLKTNHIVVVTGGASVGDFDFIPEILEQSGFTIHFQKVGIQPGKPIIYATYNNKHIFGLSGNPVSSFLQFELLVKPLLYKMIGSKQRFQAIQMIAGETISRKKTDRKLFLPVVLSYDGQIVSTEFHGSAHISALKNIDGFAIIPEGVAEFKKGDSIYVRPI